jgi:hypothetical protein
MYCIPAAVILLVSLALIVQVSLPYNKTGRTSVLYSFISGGGKKPWFDAGTLFFDTLAAAMRGFPERRPSVGTN